MKISLDGGQRMNYIADDKYVNVIGRSLMYDDVRYLGYSCSAIEFIFTGTRAEAVLWSNSPDLEKVNAACIAVFVDDEDKPSRRFTLDKGEDTYLLYQGAEIKETKIRLVKFSEVAFGKVGIKSIIIDGDEPPKPTVGNQRKIEFIGDSITCGYGNEGILGDEFTTSTQNPWEAYAATTARALNADYHLVSWSGIGIISNYTGEDEPDTSWLMPPMYPYSDKSTDLVLGNKNPQLWDYSRFIPDCIVINLGTNDASYTKGIVERVETFGREYNKFVKYVRESNPKAKILCTLGIMDQNLCPEVERQVQLLTSEGMENVYYMPFDMQAEEDGLAVNWHPTLITHKKAAQKLELKIKEIMGW